MELIIFFAIILGIAIILALISEFWFIIVPVIIIFIIIIIMKRNENQKIENEKREKIENDDDFKEGVQKVYQILNLFKSTKNEYETFATVSPFRKLFDDNITNDDYEYSDNIDLHIYIHIKMEYITEAIIEQIINFDQTFGDERRAKEELVCELLFHQSPEQVSKIINIYDLIQGISNGKITQESESFYSIKFSIRFFCPCSLKGKDRYIFLEHLGYNSHK